MPPNPIPPTFRSWQYLSTTPSLESNLTLNTIPMLQPNSSEHLIHILYSALNPCDYRLSEIPLLYFLTFPKPASPGSDFAGVIIKPASVSTLKKGQLVFGGAGASFMYGGAMAEYCLANVKNVIPIPEGLSPFDAAGVGIAGLTAYQSILPFSKPGSRIFLNGGSGGVGSFGIQIAKVEGRHVTVSCSTKNIEFCKSLGADEVIDYKTQDVLQTLKDSKEKFDLVVDYVGNNQALFWEADSYTTTGAKFVTVAVSHHWSCIRFVIAAQYMPKWLSGAKREHVTLFGKPSQGDLKRIAEWMVEGMVKAVIDEKFKFEDLREAYRKLKTGRARGKIILEVAAEGESTL